MGNLFRAKAAIHDQITGVTASVTGSSHLLKPANDEVPDHLQEFAVVFKTTMAGGASVPSITPKLQTSWDGTNWVDVVAGTAVTADGSLTEYKAITATKLGTHVRAVATIANTATYTGSVVLISNARFRTVTVG
ncbi:MAG: hypothetical protein ACI8RZ_001477 [Myxococcota bacterium]|jgi:hypothetical protein